MIITAHYRKIFLNIAELFSCESHIYAYDARAMVLLNVQKDKAVVQYEVVISCIINGVLRGFSKNIHPKAVKITDPYCSIFGFFQK